MDVHAIPLFTHWRWQPEATLWSKRKVGLCVGYMLPSSYWASMIAQWVKNPPAMQEFQFNSWIGKICWRRDRLLIPVFLGFPCGSVGKESACNGGDLGLIPGLGRSPGEGKGYPLQYSGLENSMDFIAKGSQRVRHDWITFTFLSSYWCDLTEPYIGIMVGFKLWNHGICNQN